MLSLFWHLYSNAEIYAIALSWVVIPLAYYSCFLFFQRQYGLFRVGVDDFDDETPATVGMSVTAAAPTVAVPEVKAAEGETHGAN